MEIKVGDKYILTSTGLSSMPMELLEITETDYIFMDGSSPWGGKKEDIEKLINQGTLKKLD